MGIVHLKISLQILNGEFVILLFLMWKQWTWCLSYGLFYLFFNPLQSTMDRSSWVNVEHKTCKWKWKIV
jgi:hypothetical protein